ncbi:MAG: flagellar M-ring protein FliF [Proteobacteria bacterium]|nr:flagellar M-ring protein FliF [Pseudomonadota bacterium]
MEGLVQILRNLGPFRLTAIAAVVIGVMGFFIFLMTKASSPNMVMLYSQLDPSESAKIVEKAESLGIPIEVHQDGSQLFIPKDKIARFRMELAQDGLPNGGVVGYELFDRTDILGLSTSLFDINQIRALEGELVKSIKTIQGVSAARVHLVMPKRELFSREKIEPSASIIIKMKGSTKLTSQQVQAIQHLVASAIPGLNTEKISIIDDKGTLLAKNHSTDDEIFSNNDDRRVAFEQRTARTIESLLEKSVGIGKVRAEVNSDMDFDRITINSVEYDPNGQVLRSTNTSEEGASNSENAEQTVSVQNALPEQGAPLGGNKNTNHSKRNEENLTYEISSITKNHTKEVGTLKRLSVAVLVDGIYAKNQDSTQTYSARSKEELEQLTNLVKTAIGFKEDRGDKVEVINMKFSSLEIDEESQKINEKPWWQKLDLTHAVELIVLAVVGLLVLLLVIRPIIMKILEQNEQFDSSLTELPSIHQSPQLAVNMTHDQANALLNDSEDDSNDMIDLERIEGRVKASSLKKMGQIIDKHPEEAVSLLRSWMHTTSA